MTVCNFLRKLSLASFMALTLQIAFTAPASAAGGTFSSPSDEPATGTIINSYAAVTNIINQNITLDSAVGFNSGDSALLIQMKGVQVNRSDSSVHGDITNYNSAGRFEFVEIATVAGDTVVLTEKPSVNFQVSGAVQLIRVEKYTNKVLNGTISAMPWDGKKGGVVAIDDTGTITLEGTIDVSGLGFKGGDLAREQPFDSCASDQRNYTGPLQRATGNKGEGVVVDVANHRARKGHNANGGGGGNITDGGGGGGGNFGAGGLGGRELDLCDFTSHHGGLGGQSLDYSPMNRLFMGGGGGSGSEVSQAAEGGARAGGGIVIIRAKKLVSNGGDILSKGLSSNNDDGNGADGGGAGGAIGLVITDGIVGKPEIEVPGGHGGDEYNRFYAHGTGGGGGGGTVILNGPSCASVHWTAKGGSSGISKLGALVGDPKWGATDGEDGSCLTNFINLPPVEPVAPPSPSMDIKACEAVTPLSESPDGLEDLTFPKGYWATSYYEGTDGVEDAIYTTGSLNGVGNPGQKIFRGEAYWGGNGETTVTIKSEGSQLDKRWSQFETPTSPNLHHPSYTGSVWTSSGNPFYQIDMRQKMTFRGELKFGYGEEDVFDDVIEVFVNGARVYAYFPGGGAPNPRPGAGVGATIKLEADDQVMVRFMNWGHIGGFNVELSSPMPDCSDSPEDGTTHPSGATNNYGTANHSVDSDIRLGYKVDSENTSIASENADGDGSDDDGITFTPITPGTSTTITANVSGAGGYLQAWADWNGDGDFNDANEQIATDLQDGGVNDTSAISGLISFNTPVPESTTSSKTFMRFRWSMTPGLGSTGAADSGESEDYKISTSSTPMSCDMNGLPYASYPTGSVSANSLNLSEDTLLYQASFNRDNWHGDITAYNLKTADSDGNIKSVVWNATDMLGDTTRNIITYNHTGDSTPGAKFQWNKLNATQKLALRHGGSVSTGKKRLKWAKGSTDNEGNLFRRRDSVMGDIVHSNLNFRSSITNYGYKQLSGGEGSSYAGYLVAKRATKDTLFVGANDGMLHAFDAKNGKELFAYIPNEIFPKIATISNPKYGCNNDDCLPHEYLVDGRSTVADAYFGGQWRTVLVGTLGLGGKAIYALDVSNPETFTKNKVLWEISDKQSADSATTFASHMGFSTPEPVVVRMKNGQWVAIVANGYDSRSNQAVLFIIDVQTGDLVKAINTGVGSSAEKNGLSSPTAVDSDGDYIADTIYAGDLQGNLWAFDVSSADPADWGSKYGSDLAVPMFRACTDSSCALAKKITAKPQVGRNPKGGLMVYFGTGKYTNIGDNFKSDQSGVIDSFYGLHDNGQPVVMSKLVEQEILQEITVADDLISRVTSANSVDYSSKQGWYMDLATPPNDTDDGERVISQALLREGRLIFTTLAPSQSECTWSGKSWLMELNAVDGARLKEIPIDLNNDKSFTELDNVAYNDNSTIISGVRKPSLGMIFDSPAIISHSASTEGKYLTGTDDVGMLRESSSRFSGRMSWKKLK